MARKSERNHEAYRKLGFLTKYKSEWSGSLTIDEQETEDRRTIIFLKNYNS